MNMDKCCWNERIIEEIFPENLHNIIKSIPICVGEQDRLIWCPTSFGNFSVRSSYWTNNKAQFCSASRIDKKMWN